MELKAHAKINLTLEVLGRRPDGFHQIRTVLQELALYDTIHLEEISSGRIELICSDATLPAGEKNLAYQAAHFLQERYAPAKGVRIRLLKEIPVAAGLGGGSSNAAAVLKGLNELWGLFLEKATLAKLGAFLGSDVPFFLYGGTCLAEGRGERVQALPSFPAVKVLLVAPAGLKLSAAQVYGCLDLDKIPESIATTELLAFLTAKQKSPENDHAPAEMNKRFHHQFSNHLEQPVFSRYKDIAWIKQKLSKHGLPALLSGSGPTVFALSRNGEKLQKVSRAFAKGYRVILTETTKS